jgi:hypothetical protein
MAVAPRLRKRELTGCGNATPFARPPVKRLS